MTSETKWITRVVSALAMRGISNGVVIPVMINI